jgi:Outer membrane protein beta-barrel domain
MKGTTRQLLGLAIVVVIVAGGTAYAQEEPDDDPRGNVNVGMNLGAPLNPVARFANLGWGLTTGAGYNFTRRHAVIGEFMWTKLFPIGAALSPIRAALQDPTVSARSNLLSLTGNYRFELRGKALGMYLIAGGGWYYRTTSLSKSVVTGSNVTCTPTWLWFGFSCTSGTVTANQTIASTSSSTMGVNGGIGFTARVGDAPYRVYVESRYHYAPTSRVNTQLVNVSVGIRY